MKSRIAVGIAIAVWMAVALGIATALAVWIPAPTPVIAGMRGDTEPPNRDMPHGDFTSANLHHVLPPWWWAIPVGTAILVIAPVLFWKHRRAYAASASLVLCVWIVLGWKRSYRGMESLGVDWWRASGYEAIYYKSVTVGSSDGGVALAYSVSWWGPIETWGKVPRGASLVQVKPTPTLGYSRDERLFYPGLRQETSVGLIPYGHARNHGYYTIGAELRRPPRNQMPRTPVIANEAVVAPYWLLLIVFSITPLWWTIWFLRQRNRKSNDRCLTCGYDLRASQGLCPECGTAIPPIGGAAVAPDAQPSAGDVH